MIVTAPAAYGSFDDFYDNWRDNAEKLYPLLEQIRHARVMAFYFDGDDFDPGERSRAIPAERKLPLSSSISRRSSAAISPPPPGNSPGSMAAASSASSTPRRPATARAAAATASGPAPKARWRSILDDTQRR